MALPKDLIPVGKIVSVYGVKGWLKVLSYTEPRENLLGYAPLFLKKKVLKKKSVEAVERSEAEASFISIEIKESREQGLGFVAHLNGLDDRDEAQSYCQREIFAARQMLPELEAGDYYWHQLVGLKVFSSFGGEGSEQEPEKLLGTVKQMLETGSNDVMVVSSCKGSIDKRERLVPYLIDHYQVEVDLDAGRLSVNWDPEF